MDYTPFIITFKLAFFTTLILFVISIPIAYLFAFTKWKGKLLVESLIMLPIVLPPTVLGFYFLILLGPNSSIGKWLESSFGLSLAFSFEGILLGSIIFCMPFMISPIINGFKSIPQNIIESTKLLNKSRLNALWFVFIPLIRKNIISGVLLTFAHTIGEFGLVLMIGGKMQETNVASVAIYNEMNAMNYEAVHSFAFTLLIISFLLIISLNLVIRNTKNSGIA